MNRSRLSHCVFFCSRHIDAPLSHKYLVLHSLGKGPRTWLVDCRQNSIQQSIWCNRKTETHVIHNYCIHQASRIRPRVSIGINPGADWLSQSHPAIKWFLHKFDSPNINLFSPPPHQLTPTQDGTFSLCHFSPQLSYNLLFSSQLYK